MLWDDIIGHLEMWQKCKHLMSERKHQKSESAATRKRQLRQHYGNAHELSCIVVQEFPIFPSCISDEAVTLR